MSMISFYSSDSVDTHPSPRPSPREGRGRVIWQRQVPAGCVQRYAAIETSDSSLSPHGERVGVRGEPGSEPRNGRNHMVLHCGFLLILFLLRLAASRFAQVNVC